MDTALLFAGAPRFSDVFDGGLIVLDSVHAAETAKTLDAGRVVPVHYDSWAHFTEGRTELAAAFASAGPADRLDWGRRPDRHRMVRPLLVTAAGQAAPRQCAGCGQVPRHAGLGLCSACWQRHSNRPFSAAENLAARLRAGALAG